MSSTIKKIVIWKDGLVEIVTNCPKCDKLNSHIIHNVSENLGYKIEVNFEKLGYGTCKTCKVDRGYRYKLHNVSQN